MTKSEPKTAEPTVESSTPKTYAPPNPAPKMVPAPSITPGHRRLSPSELELVAKTRAVGEACKDLFAAMNAASQAEESSGERVEIDPRCAAHARTQLQDGLMWATRAITRPTHF